MKQQVFEIDIQCQSCGGTGLYVGMAERDGAAVVCHVCKGTGKYHHKFTYLPFTGRAERGDVRRVFQSGCGYVHCADDTTDKEGVEIKFSQAGATYKEWLNGKKPLPLKTLYCPLQWSGQMWSGPYCKENYIGMITSCKNRCNMAECWKLYDEENPQ